jgi:protein gp37
VDGEIMVKTMQKTKIEWADYTWNPAVGCSRVSSGCDNCYAKAIVHRFPNLTGWDFYEYYCGPNGGEDGEPIGWDGIAHFKPERLEEPFHLRPGKDRPHRIFVCSMSDLFHESLSNEQISAVFGVMAATPQHKYVVLTKRPERALEWFKIVLPSLLFPIVEKLGVDRSLLPHILQWPLPNVIMCASVEDQKTSDERIPLLLQIPSAKRFVSVEPMLEKIDVKRYLKCHCDEYWPGQGHPLDCPAKGGVNLIICGAETGSGKRPFRDEWALYLRDQCAAAGVPFFFKKDGAGRSTLNGVKYMEWLK